MVSEKDSKGILEKLDWIKASVIVLYQLILHISREQKFSSFQSVSVCTDAHSVKYLILLSFLYNCGVIKVQCNYEFFYNS